MAIFLLGALPGAALCGDPPIRVLPITVAVDAGFQEYPLWKGLVRRAVERGTEDLAADTGLSFKVLEPCLWSPPDSARTWEEVLFRAKEEIGSGDGLTAVFLADRPAHLRRTEDMGIATLAEPTLIVLCPAKPAEREDLAGHLALFFRHELGHVFGVPHMEGRTVMNPRPQELGKDFDPLALDILRANRNMDFTAPHPFEGSDLTVLRDVYFILDGRGEMETVLLRDLGAALYRADRREEAWEVLRAAVRRERGSGVARLRMAVLGASHGDTLLVRELLEGLPDEEVPEYLQGTQGQLWLELGEYEKARECLDRAVEYNPERFEPLFNRGLSWLYQDRPAEAIRDFEAALAVAERPEGWFNLGLAHRRSDRPEDARRAFERYLELVPEGGRSREARKFLNQGG